MCGSLLILKVGKRGEYSAPSIDCRKSRLRESSNQPVAVLEDSCAAIQDDGWLSQHRTAGNHNFDEGARMGVRESQLSTKFFGALLHASDADSNAVRLQLGNSPVDPFAIITHGHHDLTIFLAQSNPHLSRV